MIIDLILIWIIVVIIVDISGINTTVNQVLNILFDKEKKRINIKLCDFCINWWLSLLYIICMNQVSLVNIAVILGLSTLAPILSNLIWNIRDILTKIINFMV